MDDVRIKSGLIVRSLWYHSGMPCRRFFPQARRYIYAKGDQAPDSRMPRAMQGAE